MEVAGSIGLVTGANRGLGRAFARARIEHGSAKVYAGVRDPSSVSDPDLTAVQLDVTDPDQVAHAAERMTDVTIVINNAGVSTGGTALDVSLEDARRQLEVNYLGGLSVAKAFAPILAVNGGGALVNMLSVSAWAASPELCTYAASKAAAWAITNALRVELRSQGTLVIGVYAGYIETDMAASIQAEKISPERVASATIEAIAAGTEEVLADELMRRVKSALHDDQKLIYPVIQAQYDAATT